ncbi:MAG TPA: deoxynucleoside kinase [Gallionella sp.]|nr:deoxynucleoside kinase [Gallionella sp.]
MKMFRIEICGGIASGKTTLANLLSPAIGQVVLEDFSNNPFWRAFYADPNNTAFETEITFLLQHYHQIKMANLQGESFACDFSPLLDYVYAHVTLSGSRFDTFKNVYSEACSHLAPPTLLVYLRCDPAVELERIHARGRDVEASITVDYLAALNGRLDSLVASLPAAQAVLPLDSVHYDFARDEQAKAEVVKLVADRLTALARN